MSVSPILTMRSLSWLQTLSVPAFRVELSNSMAAWLCDCGRASALFQSSSAAAAAVLGSAPPVQGIEGPCDMFVFHEFGIPAVLWGARGSNTHNPDEYVELNSVERCRCGFVVLRVPVVRRRSLTRMSPFFSLCLGRSFYCSFVRVRQTSTSCWRRIALIPKTGNWRIRQRWLIRSVISSTKPQRTSGKHSPGNPGFGARAEEPCGSAVVCR